MRAALRVLVANGNLTERDAIAGALAALPGVAVELDLPGGDVGRVAAAAPADVVVVANAHARDAVEAVRELQQVAVGAADDLALYLGALARLHGDDAVDATPVVRAAAALAAALAGYLRGDETPMAAIDARALVASAVRVAELIAGDTRVAIEIAADVPRLVGYATELAQMIVHLVLVARASTSSRATLRVRACADGAAGAAGRGVALEVSDTGRPVSATAADTVTPATNRGSLAIVRTVMQRHGAHMVIAPNEPTGTTIRVVVPHRNTSLRAP